MMLIDVVEIQVQETKTKAGMQVSKVSKGPLPIYISCCRRILEKVTAHAKNEARYKAVPGGAPMSNFCGRVSA